ncbi:uncharacterized protein [Asterias amurensis]|uniref:uncharacterized protein n=1 Tax=Asterias amurensis TaxID=7602 RepID=UPI003AB3AB2C
MTSLRLAVFVTFVGATLWSGEHVKARVCYYGQEVDDRGHLRWLMPCKDYARRCSCTQIRPGGVSLAGRHSHLDEDGGQEFTDKPLFTRDQQSIHQYFNCPDFLAATSAEPTTKEGTPTPKEATTPTPKLAAQPMAVL